MALNTKLTNGSEFQTVNENDDSERHNCEEMALNAKLWRDGGFKRLKCGERVALNAKLTNGPECQADQWL